MKQPLIRLTQVSGGYENKKVLENVNLRIYENDFLGIIGPNGGGKTTLVKLILGLLKPMSGDIEFYQNGRKTNEISIGYMPQYNSIDKKFPISVYDTVLSGLNRQKPLLHPFTARHHGLVRSIISRMELDGMEHRAIGELSGGQLQRVLLGRALVSNPQAVILDEPNTYIDKHFETKLYALLEETNKECAIILISHDIGTVMKKAKSIAYVDRNLDYCPDMQNPSKWVEEHLTGI